MIRYGHHAHHPVVGIIFLVLLAALVVLGVIALVRWRRHPQGGFAAAVAGGPAPAAGRSAAMDGARFGHQRAADPFRPG